MIINDIIRKIENIPNCIVYPPQGIPVIEKSYKLPDDLKKFYEICGGISLYIDSKYPVNIVHSNEFVLANPIIIGERCEEDITSNWYIIASDGKGDYLTIDLNKDRIGKCYDSFWDRHGVVGECPIIATSFTNLLENLMVNRGQRWYWLEEDFIPLGDAYDFI